MANLSSLFSLSMTSKRKITCPVCSDNIEDAMGSIISILLIIIKNGHDSVFCKGLCQAWRCEEELSVLDALLESGFGEIDRLDYFFTKKCSPGKDAYQMIKYTSKIKFNFYGNCIQKKLYVKDVGLQLIHVCSKGTISAPSNYFRVTDDGKKKANDSIKACLHQVPSHKGIAYIIGSLDYPEIGADKDLQNMQDVFSNHIGFAVYRMDSPSPSEVACLAAAAAEYRYARSCNQIYFYFTGHGRIDREGNCVITTKGVNDTLPIECILQPFNDRSSRNAEIPCFFLFDCCLTRTPDYKNCEFHNIVPHNSLLAFATSEGSKSAGNKKDGSRWTRLLCKKLSQAKSHFCDIVEDNNRDKLLCESLDIIYVEEPNHIFVMIQTEFETKLQENKNKILTEFIDLQVLNRLCKMSPRAFNDYLICLIDVDGISNRDRTKILHEWEYREAHHCTQEKNDKILEEKNILLQQMFMNETVLLDKLLKISSKDFNDCLLDSIWISESDKENILKRWIYQEPFHISKLKTVVKIPFLRNNSR